MSHKEGTQDKFLREDRKNWKNNDNNKNSYSQKNTSKSKDGNFNKKQNHAGSFGNKNSHQFKDKGDRYSSKGDNKDKPYFDKKRGDNQGNKEHHSSYNPNHSKQLQIKDAKQVTVPKKSNKVKVSNLPYSINSQDLYVFFQIQEFVSEKDQIKVLSISTIFVCSPFSKLIEAEITYSQHCDANTFVQNYNESTLEGQQLQVSLV